MTDYLLQLLFAKRLLLLGSSLLGMVAAAMFCVFADRVYSVEVIAVAASRNESGIPGAGLAGLGSASGVLSGLLDTGNRDTKEAIAILGSRSFLEDFIEAENLLPILFHEDWSAEEGGWQDDSAAHTVWDGFEYFKANVLSVSEDVNRGTYKVTIRWTDPDSGAEWANGLVNRVNEIIRRRVNQQARASVEFLRKELEATQVLEVRESIFALIESEIKKIMLSNTNPDYALRVIDPARTKQADAYDFPKFMVLLPAGLLAGFFLCLSVIFVFAVFSSKMVESARRES